MSLSKKQFIFTFNQSKLIAFAYSKGFTLTLGEAWRPRSQVLLNFYGFDIQEQPGSPGLKLVPKMPTSKTMSSRHPDRLAVDYNIFFDGRLLFAPGITKEQYKADLKLTRPLGEYWMSLNTENVWGADWNRNHVDDENFYDPYHFEMKN